MPKKYRDYYIEVITNLRGKIETLEDRLEKGRQVGADKPGNKHHEFFNDLTEQLKRQKEYLNDYLTSWKEKTGEEFDDVYDTAKNMDWAK